MAAVRPTVLVVDVSAALFVGFASWFSAQAAHWFAGGPVGPGPWSRYGPRFNDGGFEIWWLPLPFVLLLVAGVAMRRLVPRIAFAAVVVGTGAFLAVGGPYGPVLLAPALAMWSLSARLPPERWVPPVVILIVMLSAASWSDPILGLLDPQAWAAVFFGLAAIMVPTLIGLLVRSRRAADQRVRDEELRRIAYEERLRVAREVHDVVGHSLSVINLQAGVALHVLERRPEQAEGALTAIRSTSKEALAELRRTLDVFRDPDLRLAPVADLNRLPDLVSSLHSAGREVVLDDQRSVAVPAAVDQAAYRIVQESVTNVVRHTDRATATITLRTPPGRLLVEIVDDGPAVAITEGNGITGMRERAAAVGGSVSVEARDCGVRVQADLPTGAAND